MNRHLLNQVSETIGLSVCLHTGARVCSALPFESIPGPVPLPIIGNIWRYLPYIGEYSADTLFENAQLNKSRYGSIVREQITSSHTILHLFDPKDIESFMRQDGAKPFRRSHRALLDYRKSCPSRYRDGGLFCENGDRWLRVRKLFQHDLLDRKSLARRVPIVDEIAIKFVRGLDKFTIDKQGKILKVDDICLLLKRWSLTNSLALFLDFDDASMPTSEELDGLIFAFDQELLSIDYTETRAERWINNPSSCPFYQNLIKSEEYLYEFVKQRIESLKEKPEVPGRVSFARDWICRNGIDEGDVIALIIDLIMASIHTTTYTTIFLLKHISELGSTMMSSLHQDVNRALSPIDKGPILDYTLSELDCLQDCLRETMRLNPVSIGTGRLTQHDATILSGYKIPKDIMLIAQTQAICRDDKVFERPDDFYPERWKKYRQMSRSDRPSPFACLPFGFGPRACIGRGLAIMEMSLLTARILQSFHTFTFREPIKTKTRLIHNIDCKVPIELFRKLPI